MSYITRAFLIPKEIPSVIIKDNGNAHMRQGQPSALINGDGRYGTPMFLSSTLAPSLPRFIKEGEVESHVSMTTCCWHECYATKRPPRRASSYQKEHIQV